MISISATIEITSADSDKIGSISIKDNKSDNLLGNNISSEIGAIKGQEPKGNNPFILGLSKLGSGATFSSKQSCFISGVVPTAEKPFLLDIQASGGETLNSINIVFDTYNNVYPTRITLNGIDYNLDSAIFSIAFYETENLNMVVYGLNKENYPFKIESIYLGATIEIDKRNLISFESSLFDRADYKLPSYGVISNSGNIEFNDMIQVIIYTPMVTYLLSF